MTEGFHKSKELYKVTNLKFQTLKFFLNKEGLNKKNQGIFRSFIF